MTFQYWRGKDGYTYHQFNSAHEDPTANDSHIPRVFDVGYSDDGCPRTLRFIMTDSAAKRLTSRTVSKAKTADIDAFETEGPGNAMLRGMIRKYFEGADVDGPDFKKYEGELWDSAMWTLGERIGAESTRDGDGKVTLTFRMSDENEKLAPDVHHSFRQHSEIPAESSTPVEGGLYASLTGLVSRMAKAASECLEYLE